MKEVDIPVDKRSMKREHRLAFEHAVAAGKALSLSVPDGVSATVFRNRLNATFRRVTDPLGKKLTSRTINGELVFWAIER